MIRLWFRFGVARGSIVLGALLFAALGAPSIAAQRPATPPRTVSVASLERSDSGLRAQLDGARERVYPALVNIQVVARYFEGGRAERSPAGGSGVIISPDGYVLTNFHVAGHTTQITCSTAAGTVYAAKVVGHDSLSDISVLKLELKRNHAPLHYAELGDSDKVRVGDFCLAMGNPLMLSSSMTLGIISNTKRVFTDFTGTEIEQRTLETGERTGVFTRWIQHCALILPGNSGGPLVNLNGEVIGINELGGTGVGFAIPSNIAKTVFAQIVKYGQVRRGWLGIEVMPVQKIGRSTGVLVSSVTPGSAADTAGIQAGDIITSIDGQPTNVEFFEQVPLFYQMVAKIDAGAAAQIVIERGKKSLTKTAVVKWMQPDVGDEEDFPAAGLTARAITAEMAIELYLPSRDGIFITGVRAGYPFDSAQPSVEPGDIITSLAGRPISSLESFRAALASLVKDSQPGDKVLIGLRRHDEELLSTTALVPLEPQNSGGELPQAWIGVRTQVMESDIASALGRQGLTGFRVTEIYPFTQASKSGLKVGDVITKIDDTVLDASRPQDSDELRLAIQALSVGDTAQLTVDRGGATNIIPIKLEAEPDGSAHMRIVTLKELEFSVREINDLDRFANHWVPAQKGLLVTDVTSGGYANIAGLGAGDLIVSIDGTPVQKLSDLTSCLDRDVKTKPMSIEVFVRRDASTQFVFIEPDWSKITNFTQQ
jgi:serine protease Do